MNILAVGFDIDGTLYPSTSLYVRMIPKTIGHFMFLMRYNWLRTQLRDEGFLLTHGFARVQCVEDFHRREAETFVRIFGGNLDAVLDTLETTIYQKSEKMFQHIRLFDGTAQLLARLKEANIKTGALSDFPAEKKLEYLSIRQYFDIVMTSEELGRLKPFPDSFLQLADALGTAPANILYVGNSERYDTLGAKRAGMQTALITRFGKKCTQSQADFVFRSYTELERYIFPSV